MLEKIGTGRTAPTRGQRRLASRMAHGLLALGLGLAFAGCGPISSSSGSGGALVVFPQEDFLIAGLEGGPFFPESKVYLVSNTGAEPLAWTARSSHPSIEFSKSSGTLAGGDSEIVTVHVVVVPGLPAGRYVADIVFENADTGTEEARPDVVLTISAANALVVTPSLGFSSSGPVGGPFTPLSAPYRLGNAGSSPIDWSIESSVPWLTPSLAAGQLQPEQETDVTLAIDPLQAAQLNAANHTATVLFHDLTNGSDLEIIVTLEVTEPARLAVTPAGGFFPNGRPGGPFSPDSLTYTLQNTGSELLTWTASDNASWLTLSRSSGSLAPGQQTTLVAGVDTAATSSLADGSYNATVSFGNTTNGLGNTTRPAQLTLSSPPANLTVSPAQGFASAGPAGGPFQPATKSYTLTNDGGTTLNWQALASAAWLSLGSTSGSLAPGASTQVVVGHAPAVAPFLGAGQYNGTITFTNLTNDAGSTTRGGSLNISATGGGGVAVMTPGSGFGGATPEPGQIGSGSAKCIARWDVVPYQTIVEETTPTFTVGVVAFHIAGIERVSFSLEGGPFVDATEMTLNTRTGVWEYCATIDASTFASDRPIELRAIAYPKAAAPPAEGTGAYPGGGYPRLLDSLWLYVDSGTAQTPVVKYCSPSGSDSSGDGSSGNPYASPWKAAQAVATASGGSADGGFVYMKAGDYDWGQPGGGPVPPTRDRWLTFRPAPGVARDQVRIVSGGYPGMAIDRLRLSGVTLTHYVHGDDGGSGGSDTVWMEDVVCTGSGLSSTTHFGGWNPGFASVCWTGVTATDDGNGIPSGITLARSVTCARNWRGPQRPKLIVNSTFDTINDGGTSVHPSFLSWNFAGAQSVYDNAILYGVRATNLNALGIFYKDTGYLRNVAVINTVIGLLGSGGYQIGENCSELDHFLLWNTVLSTPSFQWDMPESSLSNISFRASVIGAMAIDASKGGTTLNPSWFDQNHYIDASGITPGTNMTTGDAMLLPDFRPQVGSPLRNRIAPILVPGDLANTPRAAPGALGAYE